MNTLREAATSALEAMKRRHDEQCYPMPGYLSSALEALRVALAEPQSDMERLRADAQRYQFLRKDFSPMGLNIDGNHAWAYRRNATLKGPNLDAAIDAAIAAGDRT